MKILQYSFLVLCTIYGILVGGCNGVRAQVAYNAEIPQLKFAAQEISKALIETGRKDLKVSLIIGEDKSNPEAFQIKTDGAQIEIIGTDANGAMYGGIEVAEFLKCDLPLENVSRDPLMKKRGLKMNQPIDGVSIEHIFNNNNNNTTIRKTPIPFKFKNKGALIDNDYKLVVENIEKKQYSLYDIKDDKSEIEDILATHNEKGMEMIEYYERWLESVKNSVAGNDYKGGLSVPDPKPQFWWDNPKYKPYIEKWKDRPEYHSRLKRVNKIKN